MCLCPNTFYSLFSGYSAYTGAKNRLYIQLRRFATVVDCGASLFMLPTRPQQNETIGTCVAHVRLSQHCLQPVFTLFGLYLSKKSPLHPIGSIPDRCGLGG